MMKLVLRVLVFLSFLFEEEVIVMYVFIVLVIWSVYIEILLVFSNSILLLVLSLFLIINVFYVVNFVVVIVVVFVWFYFCGVLVNYVVGWMIYFVVYLLRLLLGVWLKLLYLGLLFS